MRAEHESQSTFKTRKIESEKNFEEYNQFDINI